MFLGYEIFLSKPSLTKADSLPYKKIYTSVLLEILDTFFGSIQTFGYDKLIYHTSLYSVILILIHYLIWFHQHILTDAIQSAIDALLFQCFFSELDPTGHKYQRQKCGKKIWR